MSTRRTFLIASTLCSFGLLLAAGTGAAPVPKLSQAQCAGVIAEASKTIRAYLQIPQAERNLDRVPERLWGTATVGHKPLRLVMDGVNLKLVFTDNEESEAGLYIRVSISSRLPRSKEFAELVKLAEDESIVGGTLYRYRLDKNQEARTTK